MTPAESALRAHIEESPFLEGVDREKWGLHSDPAKIAWPIVTLWVGAAAKPNCADRYFLRFDLTGYPNHAPTACPWDVDADTRLPNAKWPRGPRFVSRVFNPNWDGGKAVYAPCDRLAMAGHEQWQTAHPDVWWQASHTIVNYLRFVHRLLHLEDYING